MCKNRKFNILQLLKQIAINLFVFVFPLLLAFGISLFTSWMVEKDNINLLFEEYITNDILFAILAGLIISFSCYIQYKETIYNTINFGIIKKFISLCVFVSGICILALLSMAIIVGLQINSVHMSSLIKVAFVVECVSCGLNVILQCACHPEWYLVEE